jgi:hypothetical protein
MATSYRGSVPRADATLWYGPFRAHLGRLFIGIGLSLSLAFSSLRATYTRFHSLICQRPGMCLVTEGGFPFKPHVVERFEVDAVQDVKNYRTTGKNAHDVLVLVRAKGDTELHAVPEFEHELPRVRVYFVEASLTELRIDGQPHAEFPLGLLGGGLLTIGLASLAWMGYRRSSARYRVSILHKQGVLRIEQMVTLIPSAPREVRLTDIVNIQLERPSGERGGSNITTLQEATRVMLCMREGADVPVCADFHNAVEVHRELIASLHEELHLPHMQNSAP